MVVLLEEKEREEKGTNVGESSSLKVFDVHGDGEGRIGGDVCSVLGVLWKRRRKRRGQFSKSRRDEDLVRKRSRTYRELARRSFGLSNDRTHDGRVT